MAVYLPLPPADEAVEVLLRLRGGGCFGWLSRIHDDNPSFTPILPKSKEKEKKVNFAPVVVTPVRKSRFNFDQASKEKEEAIEERAEDEKILKVNSKPFKSNSPPISGTTSGSALGLGLGLGIGVIAGSSAGYYGSNGYETVSAVDNGDGDGDGDGNGYDCGNNTSDGNGNSGGYDCSGGLDSGAGGDTDSGAGGDTSAGNAGCGGGGGSCGGGDD